MSEVKVLVVDDNVDLADGLGMILQDEGYRVTTVYNGESCVKALDSEMFDVAFVDVRLPDLSGVEILRKIHIHNPLTRVCMMTGYRIEHLLKDVIDDGDVEILHNPSELKQVYDVLVQAKNESIILISDSDPGIADRLTTSLTELGLKTILSHDEKDAVDEVMSQPVDVLVLDLNMPVTCALTTYLDIKQRGRAVKMIIIAGAPEDEPDLVDVLHSTTVTGCLFKPFRLEEVLNLLECFVNQQGRIGRGS